jgi:hypothetical protein
MLSASTVPARRQIRHGAETAQSRARTCGGGLSAQSPASAATVRTRSDRPARTESSDRDPRGGGPSFGLVQLEDLSRADFGYVERNTYMWGSFHWEPITPIDITDYTPDRLT